MKRNYDDWVMQRLALVLIKSAKSFSDRFNISTEYRKLNIGARQIRHMKCHAFLHRDYADRRGFTAANGLDRKRDDEARTDRNLEPFLSLASSKGRRAWKGDRTKQ